MPAGSLSPVPASRPRTPSPLAGAASPSAVSSSPSPSAGAAMHLLDGRGVAVAAQRPGALAPDGDGAWVLGKPSAPAAGLRERAAAVRRPALAEADLRRDIPSLAACQTVARRIAHETAQGERVAGTVRAPASVPARVAQHVLGGDASGGGHEYQAFAFRATRPKDQPLTWFPQAWSAARILEVAQALVQDRQLPVQVEKAANRPASGGYASRFSVIALATPAPGSPAGAQAVKVIFEVPPFAPQADARVLVTAYPVSRRELQEFVAAHNARASERAAPAARK